MNDLKYMTADYDQLTLPEVVERERVRKLAVEQLQQQCPEPADTAPARRKSVAPAMPPATQSVNASPGTSHDPVTELSSALEAAASDADRAALLAAAPKRTRELLQTRLRYQAFMRDTVDPYTAFDLELGAASDDAARCALIAGRDVAWLAEWAWRTRATADDWRKRYLAFTAGEGEA